MMYDTYKEKGYVLLCGDIATAFSSHLQSALRMASVVKGTTIAAT